MRSIAAAALFRNNICRLQYLLLGSNPFSTSRDDRLESTESRRKSYSTSRPPDGLLASIATAANVLNISKTAQCDVESSKYLDETSRVDDFHKFVTILVFDTETTGLSTKNDRIIEIAVQDLQGGPDKKKDLQAGPDQKKDLQDGENSTFEMLVNPEQSVENTEVHHITTEMVESTEVLKFKDVIPKLQNYVRSRQKISNTPALLVAHNARRFDVPLLINEFKRCSEEIPSDWLFLDTMDLARELDKSLKLTGKELQSKSLEGLRKYYGIPLEGQAHRAMPDVQSLSEVLRAMTKELKIPLSSLLDNKFNFKASDLSNEHKKATEAKKTSLN